MSLVELGCVRASVSLIHHAGVPVRFRFFMVRTRVPVASAMSPTHGRVCASRWGRRSPWIEVVSASCRGVSVARPLGVDMSNVVVIL
jgi:hypothetical protein